MLNATLCMNPTSIAPRVALLPSMALGAAGTCALIPRERFNLGNGMMNCSEAVVRWCRIKNDESRCQLVPVRPLDDLLRSLPRLWDRTPHDTVVVKMDIEGSECAAMESGQSLFTRVRPELILAEASQPHVRGCLEAQARAHGYNVSRPSGRDQNVVLYRAA